MQTWWQRWGILIARSLADRWLEAHSQSSQAGSSDPQVSPGKETAESTPEDQDRKIGKQNEQSSP